MVARDDSLRERRDSLFLFFRKDFVPEDKTSYIPFHISLAGQPYGDAGDLPEIDTGS